MSFRPRTLSTAWRGEQGGVGKELQHLTTNTSKFKLCPTALLAAAPVLLRLALGPMVELLIFALRFA